MKSTIHCWMRRRLLEFELPVYSMRDIDSQRSVAPDPLFERLCMDRRRMGFLRYESVLGVDQVGYLRRAQKALADYERTGNREYLLDASNYVRREWLDPQFEGTFYAATDHPEEREQDGRNG